MMFHCQRLLRLTFLLLAPLLFIQACSPARKVMRAPIKEEGADFLFSKLKESELKFDWFSAKFFSTRPNANNSKKNLRPNLVETKKVRCKNGFDFMWRAVRHDSWRGSGLNLLSCGRFMPHDFE